MPSVAVDGVELHWREAGAGEAIVALHPGPGTDGMLVLPWLEPLADTHRVIALDLPDHGESGRSRQGTRSLPGYARAVAGFADALELGSYTLLGHSFGSFVALTHAVEHPGHAARVIASCGAADETRFDDFEERLIAFGRPEVLAGFEAEEDAWTREELRDVWAAQMPFFCADPDGPACRELIAALDAVHFRVEVSHDGEAFGPYDVLGALAGVPVPVLAIAGAVDRVIGPEHSLAIAAAAPRGTAVVIEEAGHFPYAEQPREYLAAVRGFLT